MNFNRSESFEELSPRTAPTPLSFSDASAFSTVPEVSLVFSNSPFTVKQSNKKASLSSLENNRRNYISKKGINSEKNIPNYSCMTLPVKVLGEKPGICTDENSSRVGYISPTIHRNTDCKNGALVEKLDMDLIKEVPRQVSGWKPQEHINTTCFHKTLGEKSKNQRGLASQTIDAQIRNGGGFTSDPKMKLLKPSDSRFSNEVTSDNLVTAHHCLESGMHFNQPVEARSHNYIRKRPATATNSCPDPIDTRQFHCCDDDCSKRTENTINGSFPGSVTTTNVRNHNSHFGFSKHRQFFASQVPYSENYEKLKNVSCVQPSSCANIANVAKKCSDCNECFLEKSSDVCRRNNRIEEDVLLLNGHQVTRHNEHLTHKDHEYLNLSSSKNVIDPIVGSDACKLSSCSEDAQKQTAQSNRNPISPSNDEGEQRDRRSSDTNILKEIALMNQKQCNILQGLLQQVVVMQADQMRILREINEKLSNTHISGDAELEKDTSAKSKVHPKMEDAKTQTSIREGVDICCQKCKVRNQQEIPVVIQNSPKNKPNSTCEMVVEPKDVVFQIQREQEKDPNKSKKLQDRAVSWSAIHGIETVEESFTLHGVCVPTVVDQLPSSVHTMHLHVQDYHSSASYDSISESRHTNDSNYGENGPENPKGSWTLYDNIVGHVKKFLQTVPGEKSGNVSQKTSQVEAIRFATIEKIRQLGVSVYENSTEIKELNATGRIHFDSKLASQSPCHDPPCAEKNYCDASLELQTLALKYLGDDDLCDVVKWSQNCNTPSILKTAQKSTNLSLATQHYLEKYHLLPSGADYMDMKHVNANCGQVCLEENILDITTLKRQPKLL